MNTDVELKYDPVKVKTVLLINGTPATLRCFGTGENVRLRKYIGDFFPQLVKKIGLGPGAECSVRFYGTPDNYEDVADAHKEWAERTNGEVGVIRLLECVPYQDEELLDKIDALKSENEQIKAAAERQMAEEAETKRQEEAARIAAEEDAALKARKDAETKPSKNQKPLTFDQISAANIENFKPEDGDEYIIAVDDDMTLPPMQIGKDGKNITITVRSVGENIKSVTLIDPANRPLFSVLRGTTLNLENIKLVGLKRVEPNNKLSLDNNMFSLICVMGGTLFVKEGAAVTGHSSSRDGGGICIMDTGRVIIDGGEVCDNLSLSGGGIYVGEGGELTMLKGVIKGNHAAHGGGICSNAKGMLIINGGEISNNSAYDGGGIYVKGSATINGGEIYNNSAAHNGGGVYVGSDIFDSGVLTMLKGVIKGNTANNDGGGVYIYGQNAQASVFTKNAADECIIYGTDSGKDSNQANGSGHVVMYEWYVGPTPIYNWRHFSKYTYITRNKTASIGIAMDTKKGGSDGGWEKSGMVER
jgi:predicted outer membrane repeat protein